MEESKFNHIKNEVAISFADLLELTDEQIEIRNRLLHRTQE